MNPATQYTPKLNLICSKSLKYVHLLFLDCILKCPLKGKMSKKAKKNTTDLGQSAMTAITSKIIMEIHSKLEFFGTDIFKLKHFVSGCCFSAMA